MDLDLTDMPVTKENWLFKIGVEKFEKKWNN